MSCYHPLVAVPKDYVNENGNVEYAIIGSLGQFKEIDPEAIKIPCGKCIGCRLDQSRAWADRMMLELDRTKKGIFLTLTYDNEHVPFTTDEEGSFGALTLCKRDFQLFFKRLRKQFADKDIRFYAVGEYGSSSLRPHYHAVIFGISKEDFPDNQFYKFTELKDALYMSRWLQEKVWKNGICTYADVTWKDCAYTARYVQKKIFHGHDLLCDIYGVEPEFSVMSRRPGIGAYYMQDHPEMFEYSRIYLSNHTDGVSIPKYFLKNLKLTNPELYDKISTERKRYAEDKELLKLQQTDLSAAEQNWIEENKKLWSNAALKRNL